MFAPRLSGPLVAPSPAVAAWSIGAVLLGVCATATQVKRELLRLLARVGIDDRLTYRHPAVVAGVGTLLLIVSGRFSGRWVRGCARLLCGHEDSPFVVRSRGAWERSPGSLISC